MRSLPQLVRPLRDSMLLLLAGRSAIMALALVATAIMTRALGTGEFGFYRTIVAYLGFASVVASLGLNLTVVRAISRAGADQARILGNAITLRLVTGGVLLALFAAAAWMLPLAPVVRTGIALGALGSLALTMHQLLTGLFQQRLRQLGVVAAEVSGAAVLALLLVWLARVGADTLAFVIATAVGQVCTLAVSWWSAQRLQPFGLRLDQAEQRRLVRAAVPIGALTTLSILYFRADTLLLAMLSSASSVGLYGLATRVSDSVTGVTLLFTGLVAPLLARHAGDDRVAFRDVLSLGLTTVLVWTVGVAALLAVFADELAGLVGGGTSRRPGVRSPCSGSSAW